MGAKEKFKLVLNLSKKKMTYVESSTIEEE
jgi:hypothetical protein